LLAAETLHRIGPAARGAVAALEKARSDPDARVRSVAGMALRAIGERENEPEVDSDRTFAAGYMYWAPEEPILRRDWLLVARGTVDRTWVDFDYDRRLLLVCARVAVESVLRAESQRPEMKHWGDGKAFLSLEGCEGLDPGDKVIVFVNEYDGGTGIEPVMGSNCKIGIKVTSWDDPIVPAVEAVCRAKDLTAALRDPRIQKAWRRFDDLGVDCVLQSKSLMEVMEERKLLAPAEAPSPRRN
jgi:hypothetical protein